MTPKPPKIPGMRANPEPQLPPGTTSLVVNLNDVSISVGRSQDGKAILVLGPLLTLINVTMPDKQTAETVADALKAASSGIVVPNLQIKL